MDANYDKQQMRKEILHLAWPAIAEQILIMMVGIVSTIFVGRIGTDSLAAVGFINVLIMFFQTIFAGLATGCTIVIARLTGEGDNINAKTALAQSLYMGLIVGISVTILGYATAYPLLGWFFGSLDKSVLDIGMLYYLIVLAGLPFLVLDMIIAGAVRGAGDTRTPMFITGAVNVINLILSSLLIFGVSYGGNEIIPAFGVKGAAYSVTIARICGALVRLYVLFFVEGKINLSLKDNLKFQIDMILRIVNVGIPSFMEQAVMQGGFLLMQFFIVEMGTASSAAWQVGTNVNSLAWMPIFGFAVATTTMVGQSLGRQDYERADIYNREARKIAVIVISVMGILTYLLAKPMASLYSNDLEVITLSMVVIRVFTFTEPFIAVMNVSSATLRAAGDLIYVMVSSIIGLWIFRVMLSYLFQRFFGWGLHGVMIGVSLDFIVRSTMYFLRVRTGKWKYLKV